jgi:hypothetical protein
LVPPGFCGLGREHLIQTDGVEQVVLFSGKADGRYPEGRAVTKLRKDSIGDGAVVASKTAHFGKLLPKMEHPLSLERRSPIRMGQFVAMTGSTIRVVFREW